MIIANGADVIDSIQLEPMYFDDLRLLEPMVRWSLSVRGQAPMINLVSKR